MAPDDLEAGVATEQLKGGADDDDNVSSGGALDATTDNDKPPLAYSAASMGTSTNPMLPEQKTDSQSDGPNTYQPKPYERWIVLVISCIGGLLAAIQSSALIIAFPTLLRDLEATITTIIWVLLSFLLVCSAIVPVTGKLGDIFGQQLLFNFGFLMFAIASLLSGFSQTSAHGQDLIGYRCILGIGGTFLFSNSVAIITNVFAPYGQVGIAQGAFQIAFAAGSVLGPVIGGAFAVTDYRWIFWFNVPPSALCTLLGFIYIRNPPWNKKETPWQLTKRFDYTGALLLIGFLTLIMLALTQAVVPDGNLASTAGLVCLVVFGCFCLVLFCLNERFWAKDPIIDLKIWTNRIFTVSCIGNTLVSFARGNVTYGMIFFLQGPFGLDPLQAGIDLIPLGLGIVITGFVSGALADKVGVQVLCVVGCFVSALGTIGLAVVEPKTNYWLIAFALFVIGLGNGIFNSPNGVAGLLSVKPTERGVASGIRLCLSFLPQMVGIVITFALILNSISYEELMQLFIYGGGISAGSSSAELAAAEKALDSFMNAVHIIYWITFAAFVVGGLISLFIPNSFKPSVRTAPPRGTSNAVIITTVLANADTDDNNNQSEQNAKTQPEGTSA